MNMLSYLRSRWQRGLGLAGLGPNEARIAFDVAAGFGGLVATAISHWLFVPGGPPLRLGAALLLPAALLTAAALFGMYGRLKSARSTDKASVVAISVGVS